MDEGQFERFTGWVNDDGEFVGDDIDLTLGDGLWIQSDDPQWQIQFAGQVYDQTVPCQLVDGNRMCANPCPAQINLGMCVVTGYEFDGEFTGLVVASKLNEFGSTPRDESGNAITWTWADWEEEVDEGQFERFTGWVNDDGEFIGEDIDIALGEGLWVQSDSTEYNFVFPTVLEVK